MGLRNIFITDTSSVFPQESNGLARENPRLTMPRRIDCSNNRLPSRKRDFREKKKGGEFLCGQS